jgi:hypothetical protein
MKHDWQGQLYINGKPSGKVVSIDVKSETPFELITEVLMDGKTRHSAEFTYEGCYIDKDFIRALCGKKKLNKLGFLKKLKKYIKPTFNISAATILALGISVAPSFFWQCVYIVAFGLYLKTFIQGIQEWI